MGRIFYLMGKSSSGKDTIYRELLKDSELSLSPVLLYTTRPIRVGEKEGVEYHFITDEKVEELKRQGKVVELREYHTFHGIWKYLTVDDGSFSEKDDLLMIGTPESYVKSRDYFGADRVCPIMIDLDDGERLMRALNREMAQEMPRYQEMCRRFLADEEDFSEEKQKEAGITRRFYNGDLQVCLDEIKAYVREKR
ncbi:MAG: guanylate kinase [Lachnospiraceae bacterium]|nr:guanylate kinase [Lachnospiraceae bacterium]